jgi:hypothetical protein
MNRTLPLLILWVTAWIVPSVGAAADDNPLYAVACQYRDAVLNFERVVQRTRGIQAVDEKFVDRFEESTKQLRLAARNPRHENRLRYKWGDVRPLQYQVEARIFGKYAPTHELVRAWEVVLYAEDMFNNEYVFQVENPRHGSSVLRRARSARIQRLLSPPPASSGRIYPAAPGVAP